MGELDLDVYASVIAELVEMGVRTFDISGGEPLLYGPIVELCEMIRSYPDTTIWMVSNGTRFKPGTLERLAPLVQRLVISLDAPMAALHDEMRGGKGAFDLSLASLRAARALEFREVCINQLVCAENVHTVADMVALAHAEGVDRLSVLSYRDVSENAVQFDAVPPLEALQRAWASVAAAMAGKSLQIDLVVPAFLYPEAVEFRRRLEPEQRRRLQLHFPNFRGLTAFRTTVVVKPLGGLTGDTAMINDGAFDLGDVRSGGVRELWEGPGAKWRGRLIEREQTLRSREPCGSCSRWHACRGGCPAAARNQWGDEFHHDRTCDAFRAAGAFNGETDEQAQTQGRQSGQN
jgi:radical SAM protein with 4Fe4S-binding SPASM domain